jgi:hypothetical protein
MAAKGREIAANEFTEEVVVRQTLAVYRELLGSGSLPGQGVQERAVGSGV